MHYLVYKQSPAGPRPQLWTHDPARASNEARAGIVAVHEISSETPNTLDELAAIRPAPAREEV